MAIGLIPYYSVEFAVEGLTREQFLVLATETAKKLNWDLSNTGNDGFTAFTRFRKGAVNEKIHLQVEDDLVTMKSESTGGQFIDWGRNKRNIDAFIKNYDDLRSSITPEELNSKSEEFKQNQIIHEGSDVTSENAVPASKETKGIHSLFIPVKGYYITPIIIDLNILIFIGMAISGVSIMQPDNGSLLKWGANFRPYTLEGQSWRLLTNCFLHIGLFHLLFNMYALLFIGILLEPRLGSWRFGITYLVTGLLASVASIYWHSMTISAGASGAIFGMYGVFLAMLTTNLIEKSQRKPLLTSIIIFVGYNLANGLKGGIDNAAHLGGLVSGILIGYFFYPGLVKPEDKKLNYGLPGLLIIALLAFSSWKYGKISNDIVKYDEKMKSFFSMESQALEVFKMPASTPKERLMSELKDRSLYYWEEDKKLVSELDKLDLPPAIHTRNKKLIRYCELRISSSQLMYKSIEEGTTNYNEQIGQYTQSIDSLIKTLK